MTALPGRLVLLGHPVSQSLSPAIQGAALAAADIPLRYEAVDVAPRDLEAMLERLTAENAAGNVTIPHKQFVAGAAASLSLAAVRVGAVNTFATRDGQLVGHNTDISGFDRTARDLIGETPSGRTIGIFGAGGAAAAVLAAIESWPQCAAIVVNRDGARARALCERFGTVARVGDAAEIARKADIVINATSLGMRAGDEGPIDPAALRPDTVVLDLVYSPAETVFVRAARRRGLRASDGLPMLIAQGAAAFAWWFDREPDVEVMWQAAGRRPPAG